MEVLHLLSDKEYLKLNCFYGNFNSNDIKLIDILDQKSSVSYDENDVIDENIRKSKTSPLNFYIENILSNYENELKKYVPFELSEIIDFDKNYGKLIYYEKSDFFKKHSDSLSNEYHFATCLIIFPHYKFEGGILKIYDSNKIYEFGYNEKIQIIIFNPRLEHECIEITEGSRLIFKMELLYNSEKFNLLFKDNITELIDEKIEENINEKIHKIKNEIENYLNQMMNRLKNDSFYFEDECSEIIARSKYLSRFNNDKYIFQTNIDKEFQIIKNIDDNLFIYVLSNHYLHKDKHWFLYEKDKQLYKKILESYPKSYIKNIRAILDGSNKDIFYDGENNEFNRDGNPDIKIIYQQKYNSGKLINIISIYNDETYDYFNNYEYTCFIIIK